MESTATSGNMFPAFNRDSWDATVTIPRQTLRYILAENENAKLKLRAMTNLQHLLADAISRLNEAKASLSHYKTLYERSTQRLNRQLSILCSVDASRANEELRLQHWEQSEHTHTEGNGHTDELITTKSEITEGTLDSGGCYNSMEFYIDDIETLSPKIVFLPNPREFNIEEDRSYMRRSEVATDYDVDGCLKSLNIMKNTDVDDDRGAKHTKGESEFGVGTATDESSEAQTGKLDFQTSQGISGNVLLSSQRQTEPQMPSTLLNSSDFACNIHRISCILQSKGEMLMERNEPDICVKHKESNSESDREHPKESDISIKSNVEKSEDSYSVVSNEPGTIQPARACPHCRLTNPECILWLRKQNARLKTLVRSILNQGSLTPASYLTLQELEDTVVQLRQTISTLERRLAHLQRVPDHVENNGSPPGIVEQQSAADDATLKMRRLQKSVYVKQILVDALYRRIHQLNQECHHHHPQQQQQQQQPRNMEHDDSQAFSISKSDHILPNDLSGQPVETASKEASRNTTIQGNCSSRKIKDIPGGKTVPDIRHDTEERDISRRKTVHNIHYDQKAEDIRGTKAAQDISYDPKAKDIPGSKGDQDIFYDPKEKDIPGTNAAKDIFYDPKFKDIPGTEAAQDISYDPKSKDIPGTKATQNISYDQKVKEDISGSSKVQTTCSDQGARSKTSQSHVTTEKLRLKRSQLSADDFSASNQEAPAIHHVFRPDDGKCRRPTEEPDSDRKAERPGQEIGYTEKMLWGPGIIDWAGSRIYGAPDAGLLGDEKSDEALISIRSLDVFVCPRCEREFDTEEEGRYAEHCQKCLDFG